MTFMFLYTHQQGALHTCHLKHCPVNIDLAWGGGGGDNDVHVPLHTQARHPERLSSSALPRQHRPGLGWGGATMTFMFLYIHQQGALHACHLKHCPVNIGLALQGALHACHLKHCPVNIDLAWGGGGGGDNDVHVPLHTPARRPARLSSSALPRQHRPGLGWGGATMTFMFLYTHQQGALHACHLKHCPVNIDLAWGGGGDIDLHTTARSELV